MNGSSSFMLMNQNKAYLDFMAHSYHPRFSVMPRHASMVRRFSTQAVEDVLMNKIAGASEYVIKTPDTAQGRGTMVVARDDMEAVLKGICRKSARDDSPLPISSTWNHATPLITIQEKVKSRPTMHNGKPHDGTMRAAMTVWHDEKGNLRHEIHDAYWKMPRNPIGEGDYQEQVISCSPHYDRLSDKFLKQASPPETFAAVSDQDKDLVFGQLARFLPDFVSSVAMVDMREDLVPSLLFPNLQTANMTRLQNCQKRVETSIMSGEAAAGRYMAGDATRLFHLTHGMAANESLNDEGAVALAAMSFADWYYDGFEESGTNFDQLDIVISGAEDSQIEPARIPYCKIPRPLLDKDVASHLLQHCHAMPRGPVAGFLSSLHRRTLHTRGYAIKNMEVLTSKVRELRRPACGYVYANGQKEKVIALKP